MRSLSATTRSIDLKAREALAYDRLMRHCDRCGRCHLARTMGQLLEPRTLCSCGRLLAGAWDAAEAAIAEALLTTAA